jgi:hypothetical protein
MPANEHFDYLQLCCLVVMVREWERHHLFSSLDPIAFGSRMTPEWFGKLTNLSLG